MQQVGIRIKTAGSSGEQGADEQAFVNGVSGGLHVYGRLVCLLFDFILRKFGQLTMKVTFKLKPF